MKTLVSLVLLGLWTAPAAAQSTVMVEWNFDRAGGGDGWTQGNHIGDLRVEQGALQGRLMDWDPFVRSPQFEVPATPYQRVELRMKTDCDGPGELFWTGTTDSPYGGFSPEKRTPFEIIGDGEWHEYHIYPFWHSEQKIILLRLDFARPPESDFGKKTFAIDSIRVVDVGTPEHIAREPVWDFTQGTHGWHAAGGGSMRQTADGVEFRSDVRATAHLSSGALRCPVHDKLWVSFEMKVDQGTAGYIKWVAATHAGLQSIRFPVRADGQFHRYNVDMSSHQTWSGDVLLLALQPSNQAGATAVVRRMSVSLDPQGGPVIDGTYVGLDDALCRAGRPTDLIIQLVNRGGRATEAGDLQIDHLQLPAGVAVIDDGDWKQLPALEPFEPVTHRVRVRASRAVDGEVILRLAGEGASRDPLAGSLQFHEPLALPRAEYVPRPQPAETDYEIGAFYFPGWDSPARWEPIRTHAPHRKPVLGWYDEGNPECVDWQIKWAVEHGISYFLVDWYWSAGNRQLEHWLQAYQRARYRSYLQWAVMWANHNRPGTHSEEDMREVAQFWVDHYFSMPEYLRLENKPVVMIWSPENIRRDLGGADGGKRALEIARQVAREAGYEGIYFVAMKWPEASTDPAVVKRLADDGYDMTSIYHYMHHGGRAEDASHFSFELVAQSSRDHWQSWHEAGILPFLPNLATGWDSRPWHGDQATVIHSRTVELFRDICQDARRFADETGVRRMVLAPVNEWGEGSYIEPNMEYGFSMYEAVRDAFCKPPAKGWPVNVAPADVGLGPYDFPDIAREPTVAWTFEEGADGWSPLMGVASFQQSDSAIHFETVNSDPALSALLHGVDARQYRFVRIRMKVASSRRDDTAQLFWSTTTSPVSEANSVRFAVTADGEYHDYLVPMHENIRWRGRIRSFRFDPCNHQGARISVAEIRLCENE